MVVGVKIKLSNHRNSYRSLNHILESIKMILGFDWSMGYKEGYILCHCRPFALTGFKV